MNKHRTSRITIRVEPLLTARLSSLAKQLGRKRSDLVRQALETFIEQQTPKESCFDLLHRLGLVASVDDLPADLSTNKKHMAGFGGG